MPDAAATGNQQAAGGVKPHETHPPTARRRHAARGDRARERVRSPHRPSRGDPPTSSSASAPAAASSPRSRSSARCRSSPSTATARSSCPAPSRRSRPGRRSTPSCGAGCASRRCRRCFAWPSGPACSRATRSTTAIWDRSASRTPRRRPCASTRPGGACCAWRMRSASPARGPTRAGGRTPCARPLRRCAADPPGRPALHAARTRGLPHAEERRRSARERPRNPLAAPWRSGEGRPGPAGGHWLPLPRPARQRGADAARAAPHGTRRLEVGRARGEGSGLCADRSGTAARRAQLRVARRVEESAV